MRIVSGVVAAVVAVGLGGGALAQEGTPGALPATPGPEECAVEARSADFFVGVVQEALAAARAGTPVAQAAAPDLEGADEADEETTAAVTAVAREAIACANAGDFARGAALYTEGYVGALVAAPIVAGLEEAGRLGEEDAAAVDEAVAAQLTEGVNAAPAPLPEAARSALVEVREARVLADGRVVALVVGERPGDGETATAIVFVEEDGRYLIDGAFPVGDGGTPAAGTPAA